jgi:hypothetical protein
MDLTTLFANAPRGSRLVLPPGLHIATEPIDLAKCLSVRGAPDGSTTVEG